MCLVVTLFLLKICASILNLWSLILYSFPWVKFKDIIFSKKKYNQISRSIINQSDRPLKDEEKERIEDNIACAVQQFCHIEILVYQELDSIDDEEIYTEDDVVEIFIRANAGGTRLGKSDLLFSLLAATWEDADGKMEELLGELNKSDYDFTRDFILKTCLSLLARKIHKKGSFPIQVIVLY